MSLEMLATHQKEEASASFRLGRGQARKLWLKRFRARVLPPGKLIYDHTKGNCGTDRIKYSTQP